MKSEIQRRNNNNRKRGGKFEKTVADSLDILVVPYSGSNARFGYGDVTDDYRKPSVLGECKNITADIDKSSKSKRVTVRHQWLIDIERKAAAVSAMPFLAFMVSGSPFKFVMIHNTDAELIYDHIVQHTNKSDHINYHTIICPKQNMNVVNFTFIEQDLVNKAYGSEWNYINFNHKGLSGPYSWGIVSLPEFKYLLHHYLHDMRGCAISPPVEHPEPTILL